MRQHFVALVLYMLWLALFAVEIFRYLAAKLYLVPVLLAEKASGIELEIIVEVEALVPLLVGAAWLILLEAMIH